MDTTSRLTGKLTANGESVQVEVETYIAREKLASMGITLDALSVTLKKYIPGWEQGT